ncbi:MAG: hypothetical protein K2X67_03310 [Burkholderiales bacterium]|nr:hypothetical protein [Burkholderiales bacterium]
MTISHSLRVRCCETGNRTADGQGTRDSRELPGLLFGAQIRYSSIVDKWSMVLNDWTLNARCSE